MGKILFSGDFPVNASTKMLYPYIYTPSGLAQWFADDVKLNEDGLYIFEWEGEQSVAKLTSHRTNHFVKFEFFPEDENDHDPAHLELRLEMSELTESVFIKVIDYSDIEDLDELRDLWSSLIDSLKETVGG